MNKIIHVEPGALQGPPSVSDITTRFIADRDVGTESKRAYECNIYLFFDWVKDTGRRIIEMERADIIEYKEDMKAAGLAANSINSYLTVVKLFFEWAEGLKIYPNISAGIKGLKVAKGHKKLPLSVKEVKKMLKAIDKSTVVGLRDYALINLLLRAGLRTIEATRINVGDIKDFNGTYVVYVHGKGRTEKDEFVVLTPKALKPIKEYLKTRGRTKQGEPLFISYGRGARNKGNRLSRRTIRHIGKEALRKIGIDNEKVTTHSFRHTAAVIMLQKSGSLHTTQLFLRHSDPSTTQNYTATADQQLRIKNSRENFIDKAF
ncbi:MAG: tyrosine-type recombinase/integrase [bacterium]|nr:tyrosine-type recombinase/integrase [bacterium]